MLGLSFQSSRRMKNRDLTEIPFNVRQSQNCVCLSIVYKFLRTKQLKTDKDINTK